MKKYLLFAGLLFLSACTMSSVNANNADPATSTASNVYVSQFPDVPIPTGMKTEPKEAFTTISSSGDKVGKEAFSGRIEHASLGATMALNLKNQGWTLLGIVQSQRIFQLYAKGSRYLVITIEDGSTGSDMELWMISQMATQGAQSQAVFNFNNANQNTQSNPPQGNVPNTPPPSLPSSDFDSFGSESLLN